MNAAPLVSIIMPVYNAAAYLREAVGSVQAQTCSDWELLLVDDGSADGSAELAADLARADARIQPLRRPKNSGLPAVARNDGLRQAGGRYIAFLDADDAWHPDKLRVQLDFMESRRLDFSSTSLEVMDAAGGLCAASRAARIKRKLFERFGGTYCGLILFNGIAASSVLLRNRPEIRFPEDPRLRIAEDLFLWMQLLSRGWRYGCLPQPLLRYRRHGGSISADRAVTLRFLLRVVRRNILETRRYYAFAFWLLKALQTLPLHRFRPDRSERGARMAERKKICFAATVPFAVQMFLSAHLKRLSQDYEITVVTNCSASRERYTAQAGVRLMHIPFVRKPAPFADLICLFALICFFRRERFDAVHSIMPKSGLLAMTAARLAGIPIRVHTFTGQVWAVKTGWRRGILKSLDRLLARQATHVWADSRSQLDFLLRERVVRPENSRVLADGSICGVDADRFVPNPALRRQVRAELGFSDDEVVFLFLGRMNRDKGILLLAEAFAQVVSRHPQARLVLAGPDEEGLQQHPVFSGLAGVRFSGYCSAPERMLQAADVFCLPSRREGFGSVLIEAACACVPAVASRIYGVADAVVEGRTALLHDPCSAGELAACMERLLTDATLRREMGLAARARAVEKFSTQRLTEALAGFYKELFA